MKLYQVDVGTWERGRVLNVRAHSLYQALRKARIECRASEELVQARHGRKTVWDFFNGGLM